MSTQKKVHHPDFAQRLEAACDGHPQVPPFNYGRHQWFVDQLEQRFNKTVTRESVRKWFAGETRPRHETIGFLAAVLQVDVAWLETGVEPRLTRKEVTARHAMADGAVNLVAGMAQMDGATVAFPTLADIDRGEQAHVFAIIKGAKYNIFVVAGLPVEDGHKFEIPRNAREQFIIGLVRDGDGFNYTLIELPWDEVEERGARVDAHQEIFVPNAVPAPWRRIESFRERL